MSSQIIPLKGRTVFQGFSRILATETIRVLRCDVWDTQLWPSLVPGAECLRWQELPRFSADAEMIRRRRKMNWLLPGSSCRIVRQARLAGVGRRGLAVAFVLINQMPA